MQARRCHIYVPCSEIEYTLELLERKQRYAHQLRTEAMERRAEVEELERQLAKLEMAKKDAQSAEKLAQAQMPNVHLACVGSGSSSKTVSGERHCTMSFGQGRGGRLGTPSARAACQEDH